MLQTTWENAKSWRQAWVICARDMLMDRFGRHIIAALVLATVSAIFSSDLQAQIIWNLTSDEAADIRRIEDYLNRITTMRAKFTQINPDGTSAHGTLYIQRPGLLRFDYAPPDSYLIVANGVWFIYVDRELQHASHIPLRQTLAWYLVRDPISLSDGVSITRFERGPGTMRVSFVETDDPDAGAVTFAFSDRPLELKSWSITDSQRQNTKVTIDSPQFGLTLDRELFRFVAPPEWNEGARQG